MFSSKKCSYLEISSFTNLLNITVILSIIFHLSPFVHSHLLFVTRFWIIFFLWWLSLLHCFYLNFNFKIYHSWPFLDSLLGFSSSMLLVTILAFPKHTNFSPPTVLVQSVVSQMCPGLSKCQVQNIRNFISVHLFSTLLIFISVYVLSSITYNL